MSSGPTNADLMGAIISISNKQTEDRVLLSTLRDSHSQRVAKADRFETDMRTQVGETKLKVNQLTREVAVMRPIVKRMRMRTVVRRALVECLGRWWGLLTTATVTVGGFIIWFGDHWQKVTAFLRKFASLLAVIAAIIIASIAFAHAHDEWISRGQLKNAAGEWCCGDGDCAVMDRGAVTAKAYGYVIFGHGTITSKGVASRVFIDEIVPLAEGAPSPDGMFWRCQRPDKSRRCFFAPPPNT